MPARPWAGRQKKGENGENQPPCCIIHVLQKNREAGGPWRYQRSSDRLDRLVLGGERHRVVLQELPFSSC